MRRDSFRIRLSFVAVATLIAVLSALALPTPHVSAEPREPEDIIETQNRLIEASAAARELRSKFPGFSMSELDPDRAELKLYWTKHPSELQRSLTELATHHDVSIRLLPAKYTEEQLKAAVDEAVDDAAVTSAMYSTPAGIVVTVDPSNSSSQRRQAAYKGVDVVEQNTKTAIPTADRNRDASPWTGGLGYDYRGGSQPNCSTAFGARDLKGYVLITAGHCVKGNNVSIYTQDGRLIGKSERYDPQMDSALIRVNSISRRVYNGWKAEPARRANLVGINSFTEKGQYVCNIGARSGAVCGIQVTSHYYRYNLEGSTVKIIGYLAIQRGSGHAIAKGDSGGPVIQNVSTGNVNAAGVASAGVIPAIACPANVGTTTCYKEIVYVGAFELQWGGLDIVFT